MIRRIILTFTAIGLAAAAVWLTQQLPGPSDEYHPFVVEGKLGQLVDGRTFTVKTVEPIATRELKVKGLFGEAEKLRTSGIWLVVPVALDSKREPVRVEGAELRSRSGKVYSPSRRIPSSHNPSDTQIEPGIPRIGGWVFEIPPDEVEGIELAVGRKAKAELGTQVHIPLETGPDVATKALASFDLPAVYTRQP